MKWSSALCCLLIVLATVCPARAVQSQNTTYEIRVAVASNFQGAFRRLEERFEEKTGHRITPVFGSTGRQYAQVKNGAPFDAWFAADVRRPELLEAEGYVVPGTRFTYAIGRIVLWSPRADYVDPEGAILKTGDFRRVAIANPNLAPYGLAARETLEAMGLWTDLQNRLVRGENIGQAFNFVKSGNAELGFVAYAQVESPEQTIDGSKWVVPQTFHTPIEQQAVLLRDSPAARAFALFVRSAEGLSIIRDYGYDTP